MNGLGRATRCLGMLLTTIVMSAAPCIADPATEPLTVSIDQATVAKLPDKVATIVVGNPLIADVSLQTGGLLVVTGKGYGSTNVVALDKAGKVLMERTVQVQGPRDETVVVYRGATRETYSCQPNCERRVTLGDNPDYFKQTISQTDDRVKSVQAGQAAAK
jgi:Flp pilus assembly secretin CpaC